MVTFFKHILIYRYLFIFVFKSAYMCAKCEKVFDTVIVYDEHWTMCNDNDEPMGIFEMDPLSNENQQKSMP